jgi:hypothetical protein
VFLAPLESILVMAAFFFPVFKWHQKEIGNVSLVILAVFLLADSWYFLRKPTLFLLMLPMCHLFAIRAANFLQSRYAGSETRVLTKLSTTQRHQISKKHSVFNYDLWDIIGPEIEALADSWAKIQNLDVENEDSETDFWIPFLPNPLWNLYFHQRHPGPDRA